MLLHSGPACGLAINTRLSTARTECWTKMAFGRIHQGSSNVILCKRSHYYRVHAKHLSCVKHGYISEAASNILRWATHPEITCWDLPWNITGVQVPMYQIQVKVKITKIVFLQIKVSKIRNRERSKLNKWYIQEILGRLPVCRKGRRKQVLLSQWPGCCFFGVLG